MPSGPARRPSTLAVDKFRAASRPLGAPLVGAPAVQQDKAAVIGTARAYRPEVRETVSKVPLPSRAPARPYAPQPARSPERAAPLAAAPAASRAKAIAADANARRDSMLVASVVIAFVVVTLVIGSLRVSDSRKVSQSKTALSGTLAAVHQRQTEFRILNQRFATWPELEARGLSLPEKQRLVASNATPSHWFLSVRDRDTGITCSRTGELFDDSPLDRTPTCTPGPR